MDTSACWNWKVSMFVDRYWRIAYGYQHLEVGFKTEIESAYL